MVAVERELQQEISACFDACSLAYDPLKALFARLQTLRVSGAWSEANLLSIQRQTLKLLFDAAASYRR